jgi:CRISPR/Cas system CSM-associated protein Csm2 small subunit
MLTFLTMHRLLLPFFAVVLTVSAQEGSGQPPAGRGSIFGGGMRDRQNYSFDKLSDAEKTKVRAALEQAWSKPELAAARDRLMKANEEFRSTMREVIKAIDPEVVALLDKTKPDTPAIAMEPWPKPEREDFVAASLDRLRNEMKAYARPDRRDAMDALHAKLLENPELAALVIKLKAAPVAERAAAFEPVKQMYRQQARRVFESYRKDREAKAKADGKGDTKADAKQP